MGAFTFVAYDLLSTFFNQEIKVESWKTGYAGISPLLWDLGVKRAKLLQNVFDQKKAGENPAFFCIL